jgi:putative selenate reductase
VAELVPLPLGRLVSRMFRELDQTQSIFDLPARKFVTGLPGRDLSARFHGHVASTPLGPAAGPQTQLAQNIVLAFLGGGRIFELKTVQIMDTLKIVRPCIDMRLAGYNVEWSQELTLEQSLEEYVKASMLVEMLVASGKLKLQAGFEKTVFDMSVGYDLAGIKNPRVQAFLHGMMDCTDVVNRLRKQIPDGWKHLRDLDFRTRLSDSLTLSTFHGCPPSEIELIANHLLKDVGLNTIVKLNPTLLGKQDLRGLLNGKLGYPDHVPDEAFEKDAQWTQAMDFVGRLGDQAKALGRSFGVKFTNTLVVENQGDFLPKAEKLSYLSGPPLHVLAMTIVGRFRKHFGDRFPISFSAGINKANFGDAAALGLVPVTVCSDLLRTGGYGRMESYFKELEPRMASVGAHNLDEWVVLGLGNALPALEAATTDEQVRSACKAAITAKAGLGKAAPPDVMTRWVSHARLLNTQAYAATVADNAKYAYAANKKPPPKVGSRLELLDCLTCDKCVPVCPNNANFTFTIPPTQIPVVKLRLEGSAWTRLEAGTLKVEEKHQIANFADFCNECGNCDVFCPEDGGPYVMKPRFFGSHEEWKKYKDHDGFFLERRTGGHAVSGRFKGQDFQLVLDGGKATYSGQGFEVHFQETSPENVLEGHASVEVDLTYFHLMRWLSAAVLDGNDVNYVNAGAPA